MTIPRSGTLENPNQLLIPILQVDSTEIDDVAAELEEDGRR
jgi:hypothetical protein